MAVALEQAIDDLARNANDRAPGTGRGDPMHALFVEHYLPRRLTVYAQYGGYFIDAE
ncbi:MAG: hypothetical protein WBY44_15545 [Bryobacteraceae bacterium]